MTDPKEVTYEEEVMEDERTREIIPRGADKIPASTEQKTIINVHQIGVLDVDQNAVEIITAPLDENDVQIRPDGIVYLPWTWRAKRLNEAFGIFKWGMIPQGSPIIKEIDDKLTLVVWGWWLVVKGVPVAFSYGETSYRPSNKTMSYGDACEGAKSNALSRNCKQIGMSDIDLYSADWVRDWKAKHAERVRNPDGNYPEFIWRKKIAKNGSKPAEQKQEESVVKKGGAFYLEKMQTQESVEPVAMPADGKAEPVYEDLFTWADLKAKEKEIALATGLSKAKVAIGLASFDKSSSYSYQEVLKKLKGE